jgi:hypothetical protein
MAPLEQLGVIEELVLNRASPAEIRPYLLSLRPQIEDLLQKAETYATLAKSNTTVKHEQSTLEKAARTKIAQLTLQNQDLERQLRIKSIGF